MLSNVVYVLYRYATYIFNGHKGNLNEYCNAILRYTLPCEGCSRCNQKNYLLAGSSNLNTRWWHVFVPRVTAPIGIKKFIQRYQHKSKTATLCFIL